MNNPLLHPPRIIRLQRLKRMREKPYIPRLLAIPTRRQLLSPAANDHSRSRTDSHTHHAHASPMRAGTRKPSPLHCEAPCAD